MPDTTLADRIRARCDQLLDDSIDADGLGIPSPELEIAVAAVRAVLDLHRPLGVYRECGHHHDDDEPDVVEVDDVGYVCAAGLMYMACEECCDSGGASSDRCTNTHDHEREQYCPTLCAIATAMGIKEADRA